MTNLGPRTRLVFCLAIVLAASMVRADDFSASLWKLKVDPPATTPPVPASKDFAIPYPTNFGQGNETVYPSSPSHFVAIGKNAFDNDVRQVWDLSTRKLVGTFKGQIGFDEKSVALRRRRGLPRWQADVPQDNRGPGLEERPGRPDLRPRLAVHRFRQLRGE